MFYFMRTYQIQYDTNKQRLWVNASTGENVARFNSKAGIDIHNSIEDQFMGKPECQYCTHAVPTQEDFNIFCEKVKEYFKVDIDKSQIILLK